MQTIDPCPGWSHDPEDYELMSDASHEACCMPREHRHVMGDFLYEYRQTLIPETERCALQYPIGKESALGSCGGEKGHEHPHVWLWNDWVVTSCSKVRRDAYSS